MRNLLLAGAALLVSTVASQAAPMLSYQVLDGTTVIGTGSSTSGSISINAQDAVFSVGGFATAYPVLTSPNFATNNFTTNVGTAGGQLTLKITETGLTSYTGSIMNTFTLNSLTSPSFTTGTLSNYFDASNAAFGTATLLATTNYGGMGSFSSTIGSTASMPSTFSETAIYALNFASGQGGSLSASTQLVSTPEPASMALLGAGLAGIGFIRRRRAA